jgi:hypothetical protein
MGVLKTSVQEFLGLFVEDGSLAVAIVIWALAARTIFRILPFDAKGDAVLWTVGLLAILMENVRRTVARARRP